MAFFIALIKVVVRCNRCMGFKKSHKNASKKCRNSGRGQRGRGLGKTFKKAITSNLGKLAISQGLAHASKLYDMGTSWIKNKKIRKILQSNTAKGLLNKGIDKACSKL